ncbi:MAG: hypothetical protein RL291_393 [Pseudomonadota bacterium]
MGARTDQPFSDFDRAMMQLALRQASRGLGTTAPNPAVGAVIADETTSEIIATGFTQPSGRPHAEAVALKKAGDRARGATMYVTLEPCAHTGRTPTCSDQVVTAGLARVVCAIPDPNPVVLDRGFAQLREAGIRVDIGLLAEEAHALTRGHILRRTVGRPMVTVKLALSADDRIAAGNGAPVWVTGPEARAQGHLLRAHHDAIIVGIKTVLADNPELTCRLPGLAHRAPQRIIVDNRLRTPETAKALTLRADGKPTLIATVLGAPAFRCSRLDMPGVEVLPSLGTDAKDKAHVDLARLFDRLAERGITRVLVEGGPTLAANFFDANLADAVAIFQAPERLGEVGAPGLSPGHRAQLEGSTWQVVELRSLGKDTLTRYERRGQP